MTIWRLALKEAWRNPFRTLLIGFAVAMAAGAMTVAVVLLAGVRQAAERTVERLGADVMVIPAGEKIQKDFSDLMLAGKPASFYFNANVLAKVAAVPGVAAASGQCYIETLQNASCCSGKFFMVGFDPRTDFVVTPWLKGADRRGLPAGDDWIIVGDRILLRPGQSVFLYGTSFTVAGVLEPTGTGMDWSVFLPQEGLAGMAAAWSGGTGRRLQVDGGSVSAIFVRAVPGMDATDLAERIERAVPQAQAVLASTVAGSARRSMHGAIFLLGGAMAVLWAAALVVSGMLFSQAVRNRQGEIGLLMAKGADSRLLLRLVTRESLVVSLPAAAVGAAAAATILFAFAGRLDDILGVSSALPHAAALARWAAAPAGVVAFSSMLAAVLPSWGILKTEPYEAIRRGRTA